MNLFTSMLIIIFTKTKLYIVLKININITTRPYSWFWKTIDATFNLLILDKAIHLQAKQNQ